MKNIIHRTKGAARLRGKVLSLFLVAMFILSLVPGFSSPALAVGSQGSYDVGSNLYDYNIGDTDEYTLTLRKTTNTGEYFNFGASFEYDEGTAYEPPMLDNIHMGNEDYITFINIPVGTVYYIYEIDNWGCTTTIGVTSGITNFISSNTSGDMPSFEGEMTGNVTITFDNERQGTLTTYPYKIIYYYDEADLGEQSYMEDGGLHWLGTKEGIAEFEDSTPFSTDLVDIDFPSGWVDEYLDSCPSSDYENGNVVYVVSYITDNTDDNVVVVVYSIRVPTYSYIVKYYKDSVDESNLIDTAVYGTSEFEEEYQLLESDVAGDLDGSWKNLKRPSNYQEGTVVGEYPEITTVTEDNVVIILYLPESEPPGQTQKYSYIVKYYKDSVSGTNLLAVEVDAPGDYDEDTVIGNSDVVNDLGSGWINRERPTGYNSGTVVNYTTITSVVDDNVVIVLYLPTTGYGGGGDDTTPPPPPPPDDRDPPGGGDQQDDDDPPDDVDPPDDREPPDNGGGGQQFNPPQSGGRDRDVPPITRNEEANVVYVDEFTYMELDFDGVPLGIWRWDEPLQEWLYEEYDPPLSEMPQTGDTGLPLHLFFFTGLYLVGVGFVMQARMKKRENYKKQ